MSPTVGLLVESDDVDHPDLGNGLGNEGHLGTNEISVLQGRLTGKEVDANGAIGRDLGVDELFDTNGETFGDGIEFEVVSYAGGAQ